MIWLYAFVRGLGDLPFGLDARPFGSVVAVTGADEPDPLRHGLVVESLLGAAEAVLPVRFGERFDTEPDLAAAVEPRLEALERQLDRVAGCVEVGVRVVPRGEPANRDDGAAYMRARLEEHLAVEDVHRRLAAQARASVQTSGNADYLVDRSDVDAFTVAVQELVDSHPALDILCTGPWAPYNFAAAA